MRRSYTWEYQTGDTTWEEYLLNSGQKNDDPPTEEDLWWYKGLALALCVNSLEYDDTNELMDLGGMALADMIQAYERLRDQKSEEE